MAHRGRESMANNYNYNFGIQGIGIQSMEGTSADPALLQELSDAQSRLADNEALIAYAIGELREALVQKDEKTIQQKMKALTSGTAAEVLKKVASAAVLRFLGLS